MSDDVPHSYEVRVTAPAESDIDAEYTYLAEHVSRAFADRWQDGLTAELQGLSLFPRRHAIALENDLYDVEIRRLLYFGPTGRPRRGGMAYRVLFYIVESTDGSAGVVRVLHVWHGAKRPKV